ncbi:MAG: glycosyltransferase [Chitinophagales bacterium]|nr:glycosyltransferase [Chitinophagales bacterium]
MQQKKLEHIVLLSPAHPLRGGIASSTERLAIELQREGCKVTIYSFSLQYPGILFPGKTQYASGPAPEGLDIKTVVNSINPFNWIKIGRQLRREAPDLIIARFWLPFMGPSMGTILRLAKKNGKTKTLAITDNVIPHERRPGDRQLTAYFIKAVDSFVVMSRSVMDDIRTFNKEKPVSYIPHPIYDNYGDPASKEEAVNILGLEEPQPYLLFFGFIRAYKGLDLLLEAMADERIKKLKLKLVVAGEFYESGDQYKRIVEEGGIEENVLFHNEYIPNERVRYYFAAADLIVQPYKSATQSGISQLAYHFEKPMVVTRVGGLPEIVAHQKEGYVVEVKKEAIVEAILDFYNNKRLLEMTEEVRNGKRRFSWLNMVNGIRNLYNQI